MRAIRNSFDANEEYIELSKGYNSLIFPEILVVLRNEIETVLKNIKDILQCERDISRYLLIYKSTDRYIFFVDNTFVDLTKTTLTMHVPDGKTSDYTSSETMNRIQNLSNESILNALFP